MPLRRLRGTTLDRFGMLWLSGNRFRAEQRIENCFIMAGPGEPVDLDERPAS
jgi:hypothetical protein